VQQVSVLKKKEFWYKQILEIKCSNLRKAEAEVSLLCIASFFAFVFKVILKLGTNVKKKGILRV
jgi:hypothetical protein